METLQASETSRAPHCPVWKAQRQTSERPCVSWLQAGSAGRRGCPLPLPDTRPAAPRSPPLVLVVSRMPRAGGVLGFPRGPAFRGEFSLGLAASFPDLSPCPDWVLCGFSEPSSPGSHMAQAKRILK